ncbi:GntR family transcriptional regulator [Amycolatopsis sp. A1MSW2902]|uniref:GntR family transcriptional regulator n=1 Tax=Amycolatopsis sp. A1MSW2902 TaxID=687413 RepID=UPI00307E8B92
MFPPRYQQLAAALRADILSGERAAGEPLPSESALCREWSVSRGPVRQALAMLRTEGLIETSRGKPPVVSSPTPPQTLSTFTPFSHWARRSGRAPGSRTLEVSRKPAGVATAAMLDINPDEFIVSLVRIRLLNGVPTMLERSTFNELVGRMLFDFDTDSGSITDFLTSRGVEFTSMRHVLDAVAADETDAEALRVATGAPLLRERRTSLDRSGRPFEYSDDRYRPDLVTFSITNALTSDARTLASCENNRSRNNI